MAGNGAGGRVAVRFLALVVALLFTASSGIAAQARLFDDVIASGYVRIGLYRDFPPYSYEESGKAKGVDVEIGKAIAQRLGVKPQWFWITADETVNDDLRNAVWKGHYLGGGIADFMMRVPYDRELEISNELVVLFAPYQSEKFLLAHNTKAIPEFHNYAIFQFEKIAVELDSLPDFLISGKFGGRLAPNIVRFRTQAEANRALLNGEAAATIGLAGTVENGLSGRAGIGFADPPMYEITKPRRVLRCPNIEKDWTSKVDIKMDCKWEMAQVRSSWDIGIAVREDGRQLGYAIEDEMMALMQDGTLERIYLDHGMIYRLPLFMQAE